MEMTDLGPRHLHHGLPRDAGVVGADDPVGLAEGFQLRAADREIGAKADGVVEVLAIDDRLASLIDGTGAVPVGSSHDDAIDQAPVGIEAEDLRLESGTIRSRSLREKLAIDVLDEVVTAS